MQGEAMTKDELLKLVTVLQAELEATNRQVEILSDALAESRREVAALKVNAALDKKAENARELGLDYEPVLDNLPSNKDVEDAMRIKRLNQLNTPPAAQPAPTVQEPSFSDVQLSEQIMSDCGISTTYRQALVDRIANRIASHRPAQPAPVPTSWVEMVTANLVREGVNKHKARELAEHFYGLAQRQFVGLTDEDVKALCNEASSFGTSSWIRHIEAKLRSKNNG
jgi:hypothetical protein